MGNHRSLILLLLSLFVALLTACADLTVRNLPLSTTTPTTATEITFKAEVKNIGFSSSGPNQLAFKVGGETVPKYYGIPTLASGETFTVERREVLRVAQNYQNTVTVDVNNDVKELREDNNRAIQFYTVAPGPTESATLVLVPIDDRTARAQGYTGNFTELDLADLSMLYAYAGFNSDTEDALRAILEFELPRSLQGKEIVSAEFHFRRGLASGDPDTSGFKVYGYKGNGAVELSDALRISNQLGGTLRMWDLEQRVDVTDFIRTFDASSQKYPGFVVRGHSGQGSLYSSEAFTEEYRPTLTIVYR